MQRIQIQQRRADEENGVLRNLYKQAKAAGENVAQMRRAIAATKQDSTTVITDERDLLFYMRLRNIPVTADAIFTFEVEAGTEEDQLWDAQQAGYEAGRAGVPTEDCPHEPGTERYAEWHSGWREGQHALGRGLGPNTRAADSSRRRPERAPTTVNPSAPALLPYEEDDEEPQMTAPAKRKRKMSGKPRKPRADKGIKRGRRNGPVVAEDGVAVY